MKKIILFAGCVGSGKTPISNYISHKLNLAMFNNDAIRSEIIEDFGFLDTDEHKKRRDFRLLEVLDSGISFIADLSIDRERKTLKTELSKRNYKRFIISINLSKEFLKELYIYKGYTESLKNLDKNFAEHEKFLKENSHEINMIIDNNNFKNRLDISYQGIKKFIK